MIIKRLLFDSVVLRYNELFNFNWCLSKNHIIREIECIQTLVSNKKACKKCTFDICTL